MPLRRLFLACALLVPARVAAQQEPPEADRRLAREILAQLVAINTTHDSGATRAARALARGPPPGGLPRQGRAPRRAQAPQAEPGGPAAGARHRQADSLRRP